MLRIATINDSQRIAEIHVFGWRCAYKNFISMDFLINKFTVKMRGEKFIEYLAKENTNEETYVFEEDNIIKAFMTIGNCRDEDKNDKVFELCGIYVDPIFQRQKIGTKIVNFSINEAEHRNKKEIVLWVFKKNIESIEFYTKMGFKKDGREKIMENFQEKAIRMNKVL